VTVGVLAHVGQGSRACYDLSASFPRYTLSGDTAEITVRVANAGVAQVDSGAAVEVYHMIGDSLAGLVCGGMTHQPVQSGSFIDLTMTGQFTPQSGSSLRCSVRHERIVEIDMENNEVNLTINP
jgi:uncharacterized membrane protein (DUF441 family)